MEEEKTHEVGNYKVHLLGHNYKLSGFKFQQPICDRKLDGKVKTCVTDLQYVTCKRCLAKIERWKQTEKGLAILNGFLSVGIQ